MGWKQVVAPELRPKGTGDNAQGVDSKIRGFGGFNTGEVGAVRVHLNDKIAHIWFQDLGWRKVSFAPLQIVDFDAFIHGAAGQIRLKLWLAEWSQGASNTNGQPNTWILDTGYEYTP